ncbi:MAG TPA: SBBP repeat-containing protein, partial [Myxococcota bacterium]|nr:SBBP repeat-containing protein [Myxococcota bacterium]
MTNRNVESHKSSPQRRGFGVIHLAVFACLLGAYSILALAALPAAADTKTAAHADLSLLPLNFEANLGQAGSSRDVQYVAHGKAYGIALTKHGAVLALGTDRKAANGQSAGTEKTNPEMATDVIRLQLMGAHSDAPPTAEQPLQGRVNYLIGNDPSHWRTDVPTYGKVRYPAVYPGVDLVYYGNQGRLEYDFDVAPGANPAAIGVRFEGAKKLRLDADGNLAIETRGRQIAFERPIAYQVDGERRLPVEATYRVSGKTVRFQIGAYDHGKPLIIDPVLSYLSYLGGSSLDVIGILPSVYYGYGIQHSPNDAQAAAIDSAGNLYVVGYTYSLDFPTAGGLTPPTKSPLYPPGSGAYVFVSKVAPDASHLVYSTYLGGSFNDYGIAIAVDSQGSAYVTGQTYSFDFPTTPGSVQTICDPNNLVTNCETPQNAGSNNWGGSAFVTKLNTLGNGLIWSSFLGAQSTVGTGITVDSAFQAYVVGTSPGGYGCAPGGVGGYLCFPTTPNAIQADNRAINVTEAFISVFNSAGSTLLYSTLFGDERSNSPNGTAYNLESALGIAVAVDPMGNFYLAGYTLSGYLPTTPGAYQTAPAPLDANGNSVAVRGFVVKFSQVSPAGPPAEVYATYLGGSGVSNGGGQNVSDQVSGIAADALGDAYVYGNTTDNGFPVTPNSYQTVCGLSGGLNCANAAFIAKLNPIGTTLLAATYFGDLTGSGDGITLGGPIVLDATGNVFITG